MRGIINRVRPDINARIVKPLEVYDVVEVSDAVFGSTIQGNDSWYKLNNNNYVWTGAVTVNPDCSNLSSIDQEQFLLCFRRIHANGQPDLDAKLAPNNLYFARLKLSSCEDIRVNETNHDLFAKMVAETASQTDKSREHVFIYIHGFGLIPSLKLDLLQSFVLNYFTQQQNKIAKVIFLTWPAFSFGRKYIDDYAIEAGQQFAIQGHFELFEKLSQQLKNDGRKLNLIIHSFGHQFFNGILNTGQQLPKKIFANVFLMASDITQLAMTQSGIQLPNQWSEFNRDYKYAYSSLASLTNKVYVFYDKYDYLLHSSSKKFVRDPLTSNMNLYKNLGNYGDTRLVNDNPLTPPEYTYVDIEPVVNSNEWGNLLDYPFQNPKHNIKRAVDCVLDNNDYDGICDLRTILNVKRVSDRHRYLFSCRQIVNKVLDLL